MKDKRIVASFDKVSLPIDREDALLRRILREADAERASLEKERQMDCTETRARIPQKRYKPNHKKKRPRANLKWLIPVAALAIALITLLSIPEVSHAIRNWFLESFRLEQYFSTAPEERESNADMDSTILPLGCIEQNISVQYLDETGYFETANAERIAHGHTAFQRKDYVWVDDMNSQLIEVLYDGRNLLVSTFVSVSPLRFTGHVTGVDENRFDLYPRHTQTEVWANGQPFTDYSEEPAAAQLADPYYDSDTDSFDMEAIASAKGVFVQAALVGKHMPAFPSGLVTVKLEYWLMDGRIDDMNIMGLVAVITQTFTFDTSSGNEQLNLMQSVENGKPNQLSCTIPVTFFGNDGSGGWIENREIDFSGITISATPIQRATGISVAIHYAFPPEVNKDAYWIAIARGFGNSGMQYDVYIDDVFAGRAESDTSSFQPYEDPVYEIPLTQTELAGVESLTLRPVMNYIAAYQLKGSGGIESDRSKATTMPMNEKVVIATNTGFHNFFDSVELPDCEIKVLLKSGSGGG